MELVHFCVRCGHVSSWRAELLLCFIWLSHFMLEAQLHWEKDILSRSSDWLFCGTGFSATVSESHTSLLMAVSNGFSHSCKDALEGKPKYPVFHSHLIFRNATLITSCASSWLLTIKDVWGMGRIHQLEAPSLCLLKTPECHWPWDLGGLGGQILLYLTFEEEDGSSHDLCHSNQTEK